MNSSRYKYIMWSCDIFQFHSYDKMKTYFMEEFCSLYCLCPARINLAFHGVLCGLWPVRIDQAQGGGGLAQGTIL